MGPPQGGPWREGGEIGLSFRTGNLRISRLKIVRKWGGNHMLAPRSKRRGGRAGLTALLERDSLR